MLLFICLSVVACSNFPPEGEMIICSILSISSLTDTGVGRGGGQGGQGPLLGKKGGQPPIWPSPTFHGSPLSALPLVYQFISCYTLGSTAYALVCVRGHSRVIENEKFTTLCEGEPIPNPPQLGHSASSYVCPPTFKYVATPMSLKGQKFA